MFLELHKESPTGRCGNRQSVQLVDKACQIEEVRLLYLYIGPSLINVWLINKNYFLTKICIVF